MTSPLHQMLVSLGNCHFGPNDIIIENYPFEPASVFHNPEIKAGSIRGITLKARPMIILDNELIPVSAMLKDQLAAFAIAHHIPISNANWIWSSILEPYLDTEFTEENRQRTDRILAAHGLSQTEVATIREEVRLQMIRYNFDTMLWEWGDLDLFDALSAMRVKYDQAAFRDFYRRAMEIAMRPPI